MGYHWGGFDEIIGVDHVKKRNFPFEQIKADIPTFIKETPIEWFRQFDLIPHRLHAKSSHELNT